MGNQNNDDLNVDPFRVRRSVNFRLQDAREKARKGDLSWDEIGLLLIVSDLCTRTEGCWASNQKLADEMGCSKRTVQRMIHSLIQREGLRIVGYRVQRNMRFRILDTLWTRVTEPINFKDGAVYEWLI